MFEADDETIEALAQKYFLAILKKERIDFIKGRAYETIDTNSIVSLRLTPSFVI